ncbi:MAG: hypothetical protein KKE73_06320 [Proteobacteria bacterium]|nr:hypothetical protein [Pseudomonadota bacterium]
MGMDTVYSTCGMCTVRCPIMVKVENVDVTSIQGNPHDAGMKGGLEKCNQTGGGLAMQEHFISVHKSMHRV